MMLIYIVLIAGNCDLRRSSSDHVREAAEAMELLLEISPNTTQVSRDFGGVSLTAG